MVILVTRPGIELGLLPNTEQISISTTGLLVVQECQRELMDTGINSGLTRITSLAFFSLQITSL